jgi:hypothetical protein
MIKLYFSTIDGCRNVKRFKTLAGARKAAHERVGRYPEIGSTYAVSGDGVVKVTVAGCSLNALFDDEDEAEEPTDPENIYGLASMRQSVEEDRR